MQLLDKTVEMRDSQILNMRSYEAVVCQRRFIFVSTLLACIAVVPLIVALATCSWCVIDFVNTDFEHVSVQLGTWGEWRTRRNGTKDTTDWIPHFPTPPDHVLRLAEANLRHYHRAQAVFGIISVVLLVSTNLLALYTFHQHRFIFKRLAAIMYLVTAMCIVVTVEIVSKSVDEWRVEVAQQSKYGDWDFGAVKSYGYSSYLAFFVVAVCLLAMAAFAYGSHKQKGDNAATTDLEIEDRPVHVGR